MAGHRFEIGEISGVGQLVKVDDLIALLQRENVPDEVRPDEARAARYEDFHRLFSLEPTSCGSRSGDTLLAPVSATRLFARSRDSNVPASVHQPSSLS